MYQKILLYQDLGKIIHILFKSVKILHVMARCIKTCFTGEIKYSSELLNCRADECRMRGKSIHELFLRKVRAYQRQQCPAT